MEKGVGKMAENLLFFGILSKRGLHIKRDYVIVNGNKTKQQ